MMEVVIIRRGKNSLENTIFEYLEGVFTSNLKMVNKYVNVENNKEVKEALKTMCGLGESLENRGIEKGKLIQLVELVESGDITLEKASQKAEMTIDEFEEKMKEFKNMN